MGFGKRMAELLDEGIYSESDIERGLEIQREQHKRSREGMIEEDDRGKDTDTGRGHGDHRTDARIVPKTEREVRRAELQDPADDGGGESGGGSGKAV